MTLTKKCQKVPILKHVFSLKIDYFRTKKNCKVLFTEFNDQFDAPTMHEVFIIMAPPKFLEKLLYLHENWHTFSLPLWIPNKWWKVRWRNYFWRRQQKEQKQEMSIFR